MQRNIIEFCILTFAPFRQRMPIPFFIKTLLSTELDALAPLKITEPQLFKPPFNSQLDAFKVPFTISEALFRKVITEFGCIVNVMPEGTLMLPVIVTQPRQLVLLVSMPDVINVFGTLPIAVGTSA